MTEESSDRRKSLRPRPTLWVQPGPRDDEILLYCAGRSIPKGDRHDLQVLLDHFHANEDIQARCTTAITNALRYLTLDCDGTDQRYKSALFIPAGTLLAAYFGSLERVRPGEDDTLKHSMHQGRIDFKYELLVDGTPQPGDTRPGRLQLFNHCCEPGNNAVCEEIHCRSAQSP